MAITKPMEPFDPKEIDVEENTAEIEVEIVNPDAVSIEQDDGSIVIDFTGDVVRVCPTKTLNNGNEFYLFSDWKWKGETQDFLYESVEYTFDTQFEGGLRVGYRHLDQDWEVGLFARNITDEDNPIGGIDFANNTGYVNEPRVWGGEFHYRF